MTLLGSKYKMNNSKKIMSFNLNKYNYTINEYVDSSKLFLYKIQEVH